MAGYSSYIWEYAVLRPPVDRQSLRKYNGKLLIKPSRMNLRNLLQKVKGMISGNKTVTAGMLIMWLNPVLRGLANYHRHIVEKVKGVSDELDNLVLLHPNCHRQLHSNRY